MIKYIATISLILTLHYAYGMEQSSFIQCDPALQQLHERLKWLPPEIQDITQKLDHAFRDSGDFDATYIYLLVKINKPTFTNARINPMLYQVGITNERGQWDVETGMLVNRALAYPLVLNLLKHPFRKNKELAEQESEQNKTLSLRLPDIV